jgi:hypothetical protein
VLVLGLLKWIEVTPPVIVPPSQTFIFSPPGEDIRGAGFAIKAKDSAWSKAFELFTPIQVRSH